jgi:hypothetical protein
MYHTFCIIKYSMYSTYSFMYCVIILYVCTYCITILQYICILLYIHMYILFYYSIHTYMLHTYIHALTYCTYKQNKRQKKGIPIPVSMIEDQIQYVHVHMYVGYLMLMHCYHILCGYVDVGHAVCPLYVLAFWWFKQETSISPFFLFTLCISIITITQN